MSRERGSRKRTEAILGRLLETYLPDEKQKISKRREKKSTSTRRSKRETRIRQKDAEERLDPEKKKKKAQEARKKNIETLKSWETEDEIQELKKRVSFCFVMSVSLLFLLLVLIISHTWTSKRTNV